MAMATSSPNSAGCTNAFLPEALVGGSLGHGPAGGSALPPSGSNSFARGQRRGDAHRVRESTASKPLLDRHRLAMERLPQLLISPVGGQAASHVHEPGPPPTLPDPPRADSRRG